MKGLPEKMGLPEDLLVSHRAELARCIHDANHPIGMSVHDGTGRFKAHMVERLLKQHDLLRERLSAALLDNQRVRWIPVGERLPEGRWADDINRASEQVIIATPHGQGAAAYDRWEHKWFTGGLISCKDHVWIHDGNVTHWMPLPDAPEREELQKRLDEHLTVGPAGGPALATGETDGNS